MPWLQNARAWWARLTLPSNGFVIAEVGATGVKHVRYVMGSLTAVLFAATVGGTF